MCALLHAILEAAERPGHRPVFRSAPPQIPYPTTNFSVQLWLCKRITVHTELADALKSLDFVQESAPEVLSVKQQLLADIDAAANPNIVIGSSTSASRSSPWSVKSPASLLMVSRKRSGAKPCTWSPLEKPPWNRSTNPSPTGLAWGGPPAGPRSHSIWPLVRAVWHICSITLVRRSNRRGRDWILPN